MCIRDRHNLNRDTKSNFVLISNNFYYLGNEPITIPAKFKEAVCIQKQGYKKIKPESILVDFIDWITTKLDQGYNADPYLFDKFERYDGKS